MPSSTSPFAKVPLPIHGEFAYATPPAKQRRRPASTLSSRLRAKPLVVWAAILAVVCFGANALVKYKIKRNAERYATESATYTPPKSDAAVQDSSTPVDDSGANAPSPSSTTDARSTDVNSASSNDRRLRRRLRVQPPPRAPRKVTPLRTRFHQYERLRKTPSRRRHKRERASNRLWTRVKAARTQRLLLLPPIARSTPRTHRRLRPHRERGALLHRISRAHRVFRRTKRRNRRM